MGMLLRRHYEAQGRLERERVARMKREAELDELRREFAKQAFRAPEAEGKAPPVEAPVEAPNQADDQPKALQSDEDKAPIDPPVEASAEARDSQLPAQQSFGSHRHVEVGGMHKKKRRR